MTKRTPGGKLGCRRFADGDASVARIPSPSRSGDGGKFGSALKPTIWDLAREFVGSSKLLRPFDHAQIDRERAAVMKIEALTSKRRSISTAKSLSRHAISCFACFC